MAEYANDKRNGLPREYLPPNRRAEIHFYNQTELAAHQHEYYELVLFTKGKVLHTCNGKTEKVRVGRAVLMRTGDEHAMTAYKNYPSEHLNISLNEEVLHDVCDCVSERFFKAVRNADAPLQADLSEKDFEYVLFLTDKINTLDPNDPTDRFTLLVKQLVFNILVSFPLSEAQEKTDRPAWLDAFLRKLVLPGYFTRPLGELYKLAPYSQTMLNKYFQRFVGQTMIAFVTQLKINYACNLLQNTNYTIQKIANVLAYESVAHFSRTFKKTTGKTPREYRISPPTVLKT